MKILTFILDLINFIKFVFQKREEAAAAKVEKQKEDVEFKSKVEETINKAENGTEDEKQQAINDMRNILAE